MREYKFKNIDKWADSSEPKLTGVVEDNVDELLEGGLFDFHDALSDDISNIIGVPIHRMIVHTACVLAQKILEDKSYQGVQNVGYYPSSPDEIVFYLGDPFWPIVKTSLSAMLEHATEEAVRCNMVEGLSDILKEALTKLEK